MDELFGSGRIPLDGGLQYSGSLAWDLPPVHPHAQNARGEFVLNALVDCF